MKRKYLVIIMIVCLAFTCMLVACNDKDGKNVDTLALNKGTIELNVGDTYQLEFTDVSKVELERVEWSSTNNDIAIVKDGNITALSVGTTTIVAHYDGKSYVTNVAVIDASKVAEFQASCE